MRRVHDLIAPGMGEWREVGGDGGANPAAERGAEDAEEALAAAAAVDALLGDPLGSELAWAYRQARARVSLITSDVVPAQAVVK